MFKRTMTLILCITTSLFFAQEQDISDKELKLFANAFQQVQMINQSIQQEMIKAVEDEEISVEKFNAINQAEQNPNKEVEASSSELNKYKLAMKSVEEIQAKTEQVLQAKIKETGITLERYQQIMSLVQTDQKLQQRLTELMQG